jgi:hypothetical protein
LTRQRRRQQARFQQRRQQSRRAFDFSGFLAFWMIEMLMVMRARRFEEGAKASAGEWQRSSSKQQRQQQQRQQQQQQQQRRRRRRGIA